MLKNAVRVFIRVDTIPERDERTDRETDGILLASTALCIARYADGRAVKTMSLKAYNAP